jgi:hypothetical protein
VCLATACAPGSAWSWRAECGYRTGRAPTVRRGGGVSNCSCNSATRSTRPTRRRTRPGRAHPNRTHTLSDAVRPRHQHGAAERSALARGRPGAARHNAARMSPTCRRCRSLDVRIWITLRGPSARRDEPANCAIPSAVSITLRICREIHRCYDAAVSTPNSLAREGRGSGGTIRWGESPDAWRSATLSARARQLTP